MLSQGKHYCDAKVTHGMFEITIRVQNMHEIEIAYVNYNVVEQKNQK